MLRNIHLLWTVIYTFFLFSCFSIHQTDRHLTVSRWFCFAVLCWRCNEVHSCLARFKHKPLTEQQLQSQIYLNQAIDLHLVVVLMRRSSATNLRGLYMLTVLNLLSKIFFFFSPIYIYTFPTWWLGVGDMGKIYHHFFRQVHNPQLVFFCCLFLKSG